MLLSRDIDFFYKHSLFKYFLYISWTHLTHCASPWPLLAVFGFLFFIGPYFLLAIFVAAALVAVVGCCCRATFGLGFSTRLASHVPPLIVVYLSFRHFYIYAYNRFQRLLPREPVPSLSGERRREGGVRLCPCASFVMLWLAVGTACWALAEPGLGSAPVSVSGRGPRSAAYKYDVIAFYGPFLLPAISLLFCLLIARHYSNVFV